MCMHVRHVNVDAKYVVFFFFKQKTAYEMRISDWSSDVCSSDLMPALSPTMEEGSLAKWLVKEGDTVKSGDIMAEIETDKATMEFEAVDEGTIAKIVVPEGTDGVKVGAVIAMLAEDGEDAASVAAPGGGDTAAADDEGAKAQPQDEQPAEEAPAAPESPTPHKVAPGARKMYDAASHDAEVAEPEARKSHGRTPVTN